MKTNVLFVRFFTIFLCISIVYPLDVQSDTGITVDSIYPTTGFVNEKFEITLRGSGFDQDMSIFISSNSETRINMGNAHDVKIIGNKAYVAAGYAGLQIINISDPYDPELIDQIDTPVYAIRLYIYAGKAFIADGFGGLVIINLESEIPYIIASLSTGGDGLGVTVNNNIVLLADGKKGLQIIDISTIDSPEIIANYKTTGLASNAIIRNDLAYVTASDDGLIILNITNPNSPEKVGSINIPTSASSIKLIENIAYVSDLNNYLHIIDVSSADFPKLIQSLQMPDQAINVRVVDKTIYVAVGNSGVEILRLNRHNHLKEIMNIDTPSVATGIDISGEYIFVADFTGLHVIPDPLIIDSDFELSNETISFEIPQLNRPGNYNLLLLSADNLEIPDAFSILNKPEKDYLLIDPPSCHFGYLDKNYQTFQVTNISEELKYIDNVSLAINSQILTCNLFVITNDNCTGKKLESHEKCDFSITLNESNNNACSGNILIRIDEGSIIYKVDIVSGDIPSEQIIFERSWPTLMQPFYFVNPIGIAVDNNDYIYIVDTHSHCIRKYTANGHFNTSWGKFGTGPSEFIYPHGITIDEKNDIYITDTNNLRIQKFDSEGQYITQWGKSEKEEWRFSHPIGIAADKKGFIYVADSYRNCIQKFTNEGKFVLSWGKLGYGEGELSMPYDICVDNFGDIFITEWGGHRVQKFNEFGKYLDNWGSQGEENGQFFSPHGIVSDENNFLYIVDKQNHRIQKFTQNGFFVSSWGNYGVYNQQFRWPQCIAIDSKNNLYVTDEMNERIVKYDSDGHFIDYWGSRGHNDKKFNSPHGIVINKNNVLYIADSENNRIMKYSTNGVLIDQWGKKGWQANEFEDPRGLAVNSNNNVYVVDLFNHRIQYFSDSGDYLGQWGKNGSGDGEFSFPNNIAIDEDDFVYIADSNNNRIQKFTKEGDFVCKWGSLGKEPGQLYNPIGILATNGLVYVADKNNHRIQVFSNTGEYLHSWGNLGTNNGQFNKPIGLTVDNDNHIYVVDSNNHRIQIFTESGIFINSFGEFGSFASQFNVPTYICANSKNQIFVSDTLNHRIQSFKKISLSSGKTKAIIVAGSEMSNDLWDSIQVSSNFAYRTLSLQGYSKNDICYLSPNKQLDLDSNGKSDDVDQISTLANLEYAITDWAKDATQLVVYLVDHGDENMFKINGTEVLRDDVLDEWLDLIQNNKTDTVILVYDACHSGSFIQQLLPPADKKRIVITSTQSDQVSNFMIQGTVSFSSYFWEGIFNGSSVGDAFSMAKKAMEYPDKLQSAQMDDNSDGLFTDEDGQIADITYLGNATSANEDIPNIESVTNHQVIQNTTMAELTAYSVTDNDGIESVWAVIKPPGYTVTIIDNTVIGLPNIPMKSSDGYNYTGIYAGFHLDGTYHIAIYARDRNGNTSIPKLTTVSVKSPLRRKAIIVLGGSESDLIWPVVENVGKLAYEALSFQGYLDEDIYMMSSVNSISHWDATPTYSNLEFAINTWAIDETYDLSLVLVGKGNSEKFALSQGETVSATVLDKWLDTIQNEIPGIVTVIIDACNSSGFINKLAPDNGKKRICISGTGPDQASCFLLNGGISFTSFFFNNVLKGNSIAVSFFNSSTALNELNINQTPHLDDNSNGISNEYGDRSLAKHVWLGHGIMFGAENPFIGEILTEYTQTTLNLKTKPLDSRTEAAEILAYIVPPGSQLDNPGCYITDAPIIKFTYDSDLTYYIASYNNFNTPGAYKIMIYTRDVEGQFSTPIEKTVFKYHPRDINKDFSIDLKDIVAYLKLLSGDTELFQQTDQHYLDDLSLSTVIDLMKIINDSQSKNQ